MKKPTSKVAHNWPKTFFFSTGPAAQMPPKRKSHTTKSPLLQDWIFRLGHNRSLARLRIIYLELELDFELELLELEDDPEYAAPVGLTGLIRTV